MQYKITVYSGYFDSNPNTLTTDNYYEVQDFFEAQALEHGYDIQDYMSTEQFTQFVKIEEC